MNPNISKLYKIASKESRLIIGLMSGTAIDGLDVALCRIRGYGLDTQFDIMEFLTIPYQDEFKTNIKSIFAKRTVDLEKLTLLNPWIAEQHAATVLSCLSKWKIDPEAVDLIASHGQTIYHAPKWYHTYGTLSSATLQLGDGDHLSCRTNIITICDFRQKHIAMGGEGAPLALYGDYLMFNSSWENRIMLNIGGIANITYIPKEASPVDVLSTDIGPGNTMMDAYIRSHFKDLSYDNDGLLASKGTVSQPLLQELKRSDFFERSYPKTTGPELFNLIYLNQTQIKTKTQDLSHEDVVATLNKFTADMIVQSISAIHRTSKGDLVVYASGGGTHNPTLMTNILEQLPEIRVSTTWDLGVNPDAKEALLFASLGNECIAGSPIDFRQGAPAVSMGKICFPN